jgi:RecA/RadA recombinase
MKPDQADRVARQINADRPRRPTIPPERLLSTGVTPINLASTGTAFGGVAKGDYVLLVGDAESGKTWLTMSLFAEAARNKHFRDYQFVYDGSEYGAHMDLRWYFGTDVFRRIRPPRGTRARPEYSQFVEEFYYNLDDRLRAGPCIYVQDSMTGLTSLADEEKFEERKAAFFKGTEAKGSYGMAKAQENSRNSSRIPRLLAETGSILVVTCQTREKVNTGLPFLVKTRAGGRAMKFFAHVEFWTSIKSEIKKTARGKERVVGSLLRVDVEKNRHTGGHGTVYVPFYPSYGLDDTGACVDYLLDEGHWAVRKPRKDKKTGKTIPGGIVAPEFSFVGKRDDLISRIEDEDEVAELRLLCQKVWQEVEDACAVKRRGRYE